MSSILDVHIGTFSIPVKLHGSSDITSDSVMPVELGEYLNLLQPSFPPSHHAQIPLNQIHLHSEQHA